MCSINIKVGTITSSSVASAMHSALSAHGWQPKQDADAARMFEGPDNGLSKCKDWTLEENRLMK